MLFDGSGALYLQRRAAAKDVWPNAWDLSVGEHLQPGESFEQAAHRGLAEELAVRGVTLTPLGDVVRGCIEMPELNIHDCELQQTFRGVYDGEISADPAEVAQVKRISIGALVEAIAADPDDFTPWLRARLRALRVDCMMQIWVDADACPNVIKEILVRAAERTRVQMTLVAGQPIQAPRSRWVSAVTVSTGFDAADDAIIDRMDSGDLVVTADIPLAARAVEKGGTALNPRGEFYTVENIRERLAMRDLMATLRDSGSLSGGPAPLGNVERQAFANALDRYLAKHQRQQQQ